MNVYFCSAPVSTVRTLPSSSSTTPCGAVGVGVGVGVGGGEARGRRARCGATHWWAWPGSERAAAEPAVAGGSGSGCGQPRGSRLGAGLTDGLSRKPVKSLGELKYMRTLSRRTNLACTEEGDGGCQHTTGASRRAHTRSRAAGVRAVKHSPPPVPLGAFLLAATQLPQVPLPRLEQRGDVHLALRHRPHRGPSHQLAAAPAHRVSRCDRLDVPVGRRYKENAQQQLEPFTSTTFSSLTSVADFRRGLPCRPGPVAAVSAESRRRPSPNPHPKKKLLATCF